MWTMEFSDHQASKQKLKDFSNMMTVLILQGD